MTTTTMMMVLEGLQMNAVLTTYGAFFLPMPDGDGVAPRILMRRERGMGCVLVWDVLPQGWYLASYFASFDSRDADTYGAAATATSLFTVSTMLTK